MSGRATGRYERSVLGGEVVEAFVPHPLPPSEPPLDVARLSERLQRAEQALGKLNVAGKMIPSVDWFIYAFVRKEAVLSSQIEGTQATLLDLLDYEAQKNIITPDADVEEVCNYLDALHWARALLRDPKGPPLSMRLLGEAHGRLLRGVRGANKQPGEIRRSQNWLGGSRPGNAVYVPPPPHRLAESLSAFEKYIHAEDSLHPLIKIGMLHVQFETIHPYLDGNGRIGRLLIVLLMEHWNLLNEPLLYLSLFLKRHRQEYYRRLNAVRLEGDWEGWLDFFLDGVATIADEAANTAQCLFALVTKDRKRVQEHHTATLAAVRIFEDLPNAPVVTVTSIVERLKFSKPTVMRAIEMLESIDLLVETSGKKRSRIYIYHSYLDLLREGTDTPAE